MRTANWAAAADYININLFQGRTIVGLGQLYSNQPGLCSYRIMKHHFKTRDTLGVVMTAINRLHGVPSLEVNENGKHSYVWTINKERKILAFHLVGEGTFIQFYDSGD